MIDMIIGILLLGIYLFFCYFTISATFVAYDEPAMSKWTILTVILWAALILFGGELGRILTWH